MGLISNGSTIFDAGAFDSGLAKGAMTFIKKLTASSSGNLTFLNGASSVVLDSTYKEYFFTFKNIHPQTDGVQLTVNFTSDGTNYNVTKTTTYFLTRQNEANNGNEISYKTSLDLAQSGSNQALDVDSSNDNDHAESGFLHLYDPASTTFTKHFTATVNNVQTGNAAMTHYTGGYLNTTSAITGVRFAMSSGNMDLGDICLYGIN